MTRIDCEELDVSGDGHGSVLHHGELFTGISEERDEAGRLRALICYRQGWRHGPAYAWDAHGDLVREDHYFMSARNGPRREWCRGVLRLEEIWERQQLLWRKRWDERGVLVEDASQFARTDADRWVERRARGPNKLLALAGDELVEQPWIYDELVPPEVRARVGGPAR